MSVMTKNQKKVRKKKTIFFIAWQTPLYEYVDFLHQVFLTRREVSSSVVVVHKHKYLFDNGLALLGNRFSC